MQSNDYSLQTQRRIPAWILSLLLHSVLFGILSIFVLRTSTGSGTIESKTGGIVLVDRTSETTEYLSEGELSEDSSDPSVPVPAPAKMVDQLPPNLPGMEIGSSELTGIGEELSDALTGADSMTFGESSGQSIGGKVTTEVFGVKGTGSRFVYVFDRSASMEDLGGKPLRAAKRSLLESLSSLGNVSQFQIMFYNTQIKSFNGSRGKQGLAFATDDEKKRAIRFVDSIAGEGGTDHLNALQSALAFGPDVLFLLTDAEGGFTYRDLERISGWNRGGTVINAIEFGKGRKTSKDRSLQRLAEQSGGQYVYKNVKSFQDR